jgi:hypothetical protein
MERSGMREDLAERRVSPGFRFLHPGYHLWHEFGRSQPVCRRLNFPAASVITPAFRGPAERAAVATVKVLQQHVFLDAEPAGRGFPHGLSPRRRAKCPS